jgi:hypothetical protein
MHGRAVAFAMKASNALGASIMITMRRLFASS